MRRKDRQVTDLSDIAAIVKNCEVCRLGMTDGSIPYVVPMNYGYEFSGETLTLYFHCAKEGRKLDILRTNPRVCFEMDNGHRVIAEKACDSTYKYESVIGNGEAQFITEHEEKAYALKKLMLAHTGTEDFDFTEAQTNSVTIIKVQSNDYTAKKN